ncbi:acetoacetate decarboxylase family protein [Caulobacter sp. 17J80-11]|uniref:acetoacetate decarboxylase family protein n=1 Tax=Caulobacter sp. 17J80-11 TaxID=2763502 RepID=UPI0016535AA6|nr:acetoacetate decarboxylase family protein [Caulobacter sp. 17J80-11]MBC6981443.1 acetoacetate decarboxylase family protein [Caulobacter sp. 17J80-11]
MPAGQTADAFPPPPWILRGRALVSVWLTEAPVLPAGLRPLRLGGRSLVVGLWADYGPGSTLAYREVLLATPVWDRRGPAVHVSCCWVDAPASVAGGRAVWAVPKRLGAFSPGERLNDAGVPVAALEDAQPSGPHVPAPLFGRLLQADGDTLVSAAFSGRARIAPARVRWTAPPGSPLARVAGRTPLLSVALSDLELRVGRPQRRPNGGNFRT